MTTIVTNFCDPTNRIARIVERQRQSGGQCHWSLKLVVDGTHAPLIDVYTESARHAQIQSWCSHLQESGYKQCESLPPGLEQQQELEIVLDDLHDGYLSLRDKLVHVPEWTDDHLRSIQQMKAQLLDTLNRMSAMRGELEDAE
jgi:hypothetical protein